MERDDRRQHAVQWTVEHARIRSARFFRAEGGGRWRRSGSEIGRGALAAGDWAIYHRSLWADRGHPLETAWNGAIGLPFPSTEVSIRDESFDEMAVWTGDGDIEKSTGELCVRGPQVMKGYWNNPEETAMVMQDGWLKTGDIGYLNAQGYVTITDRKKDMILVSGFNVYPNEIESVVAAHPGVLECGVVGVPDAKSGEAVKVVIVKKDPNLTREEVIACCNAHLTGYKRPRHVEFRDALPKTPIGKILRRELREAPKK
jgi:long-chain acyl-CoA synthetase